MTDTLLSWAIWIAFVVIVSFVSRQVAKRSGRHTAAGPQPPTLTEIRAGDLDDEALQATRVFRRRHLIQTVVFVALGIAVLASFLASLATEGWGLLTLLLVIAEVVLIFSQGTPLLIGMWRTLTINADGFAVRELVTRRSMQWYEVRNFSAAEDLSRFRAEGLHRRVTYETGGFSADNRRKIYRTLRTHLEKHQLPMEVWNQGPALVRFARGHAVGLVFLGTVVAGAVIAGSELHVEDPALGFKCATASKYLRERHDLPDVPGCVVLRVNLGTSAYRAGLEEGDMIVALEGTPITSEEQLTRYFRSTGRRGDDFSVIKAGEVEPRPIKAEPGAAGRIPETGTEAYSHYLRAQDTFDRRESIPEYTLAIELAPEFAQAYVQRGKVYGDEYGYDQAAADLDRAIELDPRLAEAYRERASSLNLEGVTAMADLQRAIDLDGCESAFKEYNYDCYTNHVLTANGYGSSGETDDYQRAAAEAIKAIGFYPEMANAYYLAAYYLWNLGREDEARGYAATYIDVAEDSEEPAWYLEWAKYVVSGTNAYTERLQQYEDYRASRPAEAFITESAEGLIASGPPSVTFVTFAEERTLDQPPGQLSATFDRPRVWVYFKFDHAAEVKDLSWGWSQNGQAYGGGQQKWPGANKGEAWIQLDNRLSGVPSQNVLTISFDSKEVATATLHIGDDAYVGPLRFYHDAEATQELVFYDGQANTVYAAAHYASLPVGTELPWTAERDGVRLSSGAIVVNEAAMTVFPIILPQGLPPGVIDIYVFVGTRVARKGVLVVAPPNVASSPPFTSFAYGTGDYEDGIDPTKAKEFFANGETLGYVIEGAALSPGSVLSVHWTRDGRPLRPAADEFRPEDISEGYGEGYLSLFDDPMAGEYEVIVALNGQPVYSDVIVVQTPR